MQRRTVVLVAAAVLAVAAVGWWVADRFFLPEDGTAVDQAMPEGAGPALLRGTFRDGDAVHHVAGTVTVHEGPDGAFLRFEGYEATDGPDVYLYLVKGSTEEVGADDLRVLVPGGEDGHATLRGAFNVPLPAGTDAGAYDGIVVWCDRFGVEFGNAPFEATHVAPPG